MLKLFLLLCIATKSSQANQILPETSQINEEIRPDPRGLIAIILPSILKKGRHAIDCIKEEFAILNDFKVPLPLVVGDFLKLNHLFLKNGVKFDYALEGAEAKEVKNQAKIDFNVKWDDLQLGADYKANLDQFAGEGNIGLKLKTVDIVAKAQILVDLGKLSARLLDLKVNVDVEKLMVTKFVNQGVDLSKELTKYVDSNREDLLFMLNFIIEDAAKELVKRLSANIDNKAVIFKEIQPLIDIVNGKSPRALDLQRCIKMLG